HPDSEGQMIVSKATGSGIRALAYLARHAETGLCGLDEIAEQEQIPPVYLRKVLGELRRHRLLNSAKGIHGGYELARPPEAITLWDVFRVLEPDPYLDSCILGRGLCNHESSCELHEDWDRVRSGLVVMLQTKTISEIAASGSSTQSGTVLNE
ncbi:MAG TPA: Rrf2 family transcriptional regulator, partial [Blastocatellia bacterium]|nr:Rrf2 family transcriptional regulator [Blastocatellia bacterium]